MNSAKKGQETTTISLTEAQVAKVMPIYEWRKVTSYPIVRVLSLGQLKKNPHHHSYTLDVAIEHIRTLEYLSLFPFHEALYLFKQSIVGFECLIDIFGPIQPLLSMIGLSNTGHCRVWVNPVFHSNTAAYKISQKSATVSELIKLFRRICLSSPLASRFFDEAAQLKEPSFLNLWTIIRRFTQEQKIIIPSQIKKQRAPTPVSLSQVKIESPQKKPFSSQNTKSRVGQHKKTISSNLEEMQRKAIETLRPTAFPAEKKQGTPKDSRAKQTVKPKNTIETFSRFIVEPNSSKISSRIGSSIQTHDYKYVHVSPLKSDSVHADHPTSPPRQNTPGKSQFSANSQDSHSTLFGPSPFLNLQHQRKNTPVNESPLRKYQNAIKNRPSSFHPNLERSFLNSSGRQATLPNENFEPDISPIFLPIPEEPLFEAPDSSRRPSKIEGKIEFGQQNFRSNVNWQPQSHSQQYPQAHKARIASSFSFKQPFPVNIPIQKPQKKQIQVIQQSVTSRPKVELFQKSLELKTKPTETFIQFSYHPEKDMALSRNSIQPEPSNSQRDIGIKKLATRHFQFSKGIINNQKKPSIRT